MLKATSQFFWAIALLVCISFVGPVRASGTYTVTCYQDADSITVNGPEGTRTQPGAFPLFVNDTLTEKLTASFSVTGTNTGGNECTIDSQSYSYKNVVILYSPDKLQALKPGTGEARIDHVNSVTGDALLTAYFPKAGYYAINYTVHVDYTSKTCGDGSAENDGHLTFAVQAGDFSFTLNPTSVNILTTQKSGIVEAQITSIAGFQQSVGFTTTSTQSGLTVSGSGTPPANGTTQDGTSSPNAIVTVSPTSGAFPFSLTPYKKIINVRGSADLGIVFLAHDQPLTVNISTLYVSGPYDLSSHAGVNTHFNQGLPKIPNTRAADGSIVTDGLLTYDSSQISNDPWRKSLQLSGIPSDLPGNYVFTADYGVLSSSASSGATANYNVYKSDDASASNAPFSPTTATLNVVVPFDNTNLGTNKYTIRWHHPTENWQRDSSQPILFDYRLLAPSQSPGFPSAMDFSPSARWDRIDFDFEGLIAAGDIVSIMGIVYSKNPIKKGLYHYMGLQFAKLGDEIKDYTTFGGSIPLRPVFETGVTNPAYKCTYNPNPVSQYGYSDTMTSAQKSVIESHYVAQKPRYFIPYDSTPIKGEQYDETGFVQSISQRELLYHPGKWQPDSHVVCDFVLKNGP